MTQAPSHSQSPATSAPSALITGGGSGIGRAIALRFLSEGYNVVLVGRRRAPLETLAEAYPHRVLPIACDLTHASAIKSLVEKLENDALFGSPLAALVNNAGIYARRSFADSDDALWTSMFETNLLGSVRITRALLPHLARNQGAILNVSSSLGLRPAAQNSAYAAIKAAMINWTQTLALELAPQKIRVNCLCPGIVDTPIHAFHSQTDQEKAGLGHLQPLGRIGRPEDIAHGAWSLCGPGSEWITGATLTVDGGINLA